MERGQTSKRRGARRGVVVTAAGLLAVGALAAAAVAETSPSSWPMHGGNAANTHRAEVVGPADMEVRWSRNYDDRYTWDGIVAGGVYDRDQHMITDADDHLLVRARRRDTNEREFVLLSLDRDDGSVRWELPHVATHGVTRCTPAIGPDGTIWTTLDLTAVPRLAGEENALAAIIGVDPTTGQPIDGLRTPSTRTCDGQMTIAEGGNLLMYPEALWQREGTGLPALRRLKAYDLTAGGAQLRWTRDTRWEFSSELPGRRMSGPMGGRAVVAPPGTPAAGAIYWLEQTRVGDVITNHLLKLDPATGDVVDSVELPGTSVTSLHADPEGGVIVTPYWEGTAPAGASLHDGFYYRFLDDGTSLTEDWRRDVAATTEGEQLRGAASFTALTSEHLVGWYRATDLVFAIDWRTGEFQWHYSSPGFATSQLVAADSDDNLYVQKVGSSVPIVESITSGGTFRGSLDGSPFPDGRGVAVVGPFGSNGTLYAGISSTEGFQIVAIQQGPPQEVVGACAGAPPAGFQDTRGTFHEASIDCVVWYDIARGVSADRYAPAAGVTRAQMATFMTRLITRTGAQLPPASDQGFQDIGDNVHRDAINRLAAAGIVHGRTSTEYAPNGVVSRAQMATFLVRTYEYIDQAALPGGSAGFEDTGGNVHEANIDKAAQAGFARGTSSTTYAPSDPVTRGQMATFIVRVVDRSVTEGHTSPPAG